MSTAYPRHVSGAGSAYYSYRPITKNIEKGVRKTYRENASQPRDFQQYMSAAHPARNVVDVNDMMPSRTPLGPFAGAKNREDDFPSTRAAFKEGAAARAERIANEESSLFQRLHGKHPYRLPVEDEEVPPHPDSYWPMNRKHFDLVSSYDAMTDYLGITKAALSEHSASSKKEQSSSNKITSFQHTY